YLSLFYCSGDPADPPSFPTRRSSDLPADHAAPTSAPTLVPTMWVGNSPRSVRAWSTPMCARPFMPPPPRTRMKGLAHIGVLQALDRKSTRLNSSHVAISYAVFCLKKK